MDGVISTVPKTARERGKVAPSKFAHFALKTTRLAEMTAWYGLVLEAEVAFGNEDVSFMAYDEEHHRIALVRMPHLEAPAENAWGAEHVGFTYDNMDDLMFTYRRLQAENIKPFWCIIHGPTVSLYYKDPDGNKVELMIDVFETVEQIQDFFDSGAYLENFMGIIFDPDEMADKHDAGVPFEELTKRPKLPEGMGPWDMLRE